MNALVKRILLHVLLPLLTGFCIYFFFRPGVVFIQWIDIREPLLPLHQLNTVQHWLIYSGTDFCWCYSLSAALFTWYQWQHKPVRFFWGYVLLLLVMQELAQGWLLPQFTFDPGDLIATVLAFCLSCFFTYKNYDK
jgi:hypothetical protein